YSSQMKIAGVIYCHNILESRWTSSAQANFDLFNKLCGPAAARKTAIVTTRWDIPKEIGPLEIQEKELRSSYWNTLISAGTIVCRSSEEARVIVDRLLARNAYYDPLQIQRELVDANKSISETEAGRKLFDELAKTLKTHQEVAKILRETGGSQDQIYQAETEIEKLTAQFRQHSFAIPRMLKLLALPKT
ncbi:hypothetical protein H0H92_016157, partial [Tricholoma furcatifolium]